MTKTLLEMAGADLTPPRFEEATLVVIDAQNEYVDGALPLPGVGEALGRIAALLEAARNAGAPVVHVQHRGRPGGLFDPEKPAFRIAQQAAPVSGEAVVEKALPNAFAGTNLQEVLEGFGRKQLVLAGFMTHMCVSSTGRRDDRRGRPACRGARGARRPLLDRLPHRRPRWLNAAARDANTSFGFIVR